MLTTRPAVRTLTLLKGTPDGMDDYGNDVSDWTPTELPGCIWWPSSTTEATATGDKVTSRYGVLFPDDTDVTAIDRVILPDAEGVWGIDGHPRQHTSPITGSVGGIHAWLKKVTG